MDVNGQSGIHLGFFAYMHALSSLVSMFLLLVMQMTLAKMYLSYAHMNPLGRQKCVFTLQSGTCHS